MSTNPWGHGVASEIPQRHSQNENRDYYELQETYKIIFQSGNESNRMSQRSIVVRNAAQVVQDEPRSNLRHQNGSYKILSGNTKNLPKENRRGNF